MPTFAAGTIGATLEAQYQDGTGSAATPTTPLVSLIDPLGATVVNNAVPDATPSLGRYQYEFDVPAGPLGSWTAVWTGIVNSAGVESSEVFTVVEAGDIVFPDDGSGVCSPWIDTDDPALCCSVDSFAAGMLERKILEATELLYMASGRQFPGECSAVIRPCLGCGAGQFLAYASGGSRQITDCTCGALMEGAGGIGCTAKGVVLPGAPIRRVTEVRVNGEVLDPSGYRIADRDVLMRVGASWPCHQDQSRAATEPRTWSVAYDYGVGPGAAGRAQCATLACELAAACTNGMECRLPDRLQTLTREGMTMTILDPAAAPGQAVEFGLREVDQWVRLVNPRGLDRPGKWFSLATIGNQHR